MRKLITGTAAALALAVTTIGAVAPAQAQWRGGYRGGHYYRYHGDRTGAAVGAGILGLAVGAALASSGPRGYYEPAPRYYYAPPPPPSYVEYCRTEWRWDGYRRGYVPVRFCD